MSINDIKLGLCAHLAAIVFLHAALMIPPSRLSHKQLALAFPTLIWSCHIYSWSVGLGFLATIQALWATELLLFRAPREQFQLIHTQKPGSRTSELKSKKEQGSQNQEEIEQDDKKEQRPIWKEPYPGTFWKRFWWVFKLQVSLRYVGWDTGDGKDVTSLLRERRQYRLQWLLKKVLFMGICFSIVDLTNFYQHFDPYFQIETDIDAAFPHQLGDLLAKYHLGSLPPRLLRISALGFQQYAVFALTNTLMAIIHVTLGGIGLLGDFWGEIEYWPPLMGSPLVTLKRGLRGFWGEFWHQLFRNVRPPLVSNAEFLLMATDIDKSREGNCDCTANPSKVFASVWNPGGRRFRLVRCTSRCYTSSECAECQSPAIRRLLLDPRCLRSGRSCRGADHEAQVLGKIKIVLDEIVRGNRKTGMDSGGSVFYCSDDSRRAHQAHQRVEKVWSAADISSVSAEVDRVRIDTL